MKGFGLFVAVAAGLVTLTPAPASAYRTSSIAPMSEFAGAASLVDDYRGRYDRGRYDDRGRGWDRGRHRGWRNGKWRWRTVCHRQWRDGRRERVCRRIRYRR